MATQIEAESLRIPRCPGCGSLKVTYLSTELKVICEGCFGRFHVWKLQDFAQFFEPSPGSDELELAKFCLQGLLDVLAGKNKDFATLLVQFGRRETLCQCNSGPRTATNGVCDGCHRKAEWAEPAAAL